MSHSAPLRDVAAGLPLVPGCYLFRDGKGRLLYVGKAKILRRRVLSYFRPLESQSAKTRALLRDARRLEVILTGSEVEALILENSLVKRHRPRFNVLLRDDKNFPYLKLTVGEPFPRVVLVRRPCQDGNLYFGPYTPASVARRSLKMIARFFQVATCYESFDGSRSRPCLLYQMHQCLAPCVGYVQVAPYGEAVRHVRLFLEGRDKELAGELERRMAAASKAQEYEKAARYRDLLRAVAALNRRQAVAAVGLEDQDYFAMHREGNNASLAIFEMRAGLVQSRREFFFERAGGDDGAFMGEALSRYYSAAPLVPARVFVSAPPEDVGVLEEWLAGRRGQSVRIKTPRRGVHRQFMDTVLENAHLAWESRFAADHNLGVAVHEALQEILGLSETPSRIEALDISHVAGTETVASVVVWEGGRPRRSEYRRLNIRSARPGDDYAAMGEAVARRYGRLVREKRRLPDLVLIDGGAGQLAAAQAALAELGVGNLPVMALAKRREEVYLPGLKEPVQLPTHAPVRHLVTRIRDEAHRFAVAGHRRRRRRRTLVTELTQVRGIGPRRSRDLLKAFGSVEGVRGASQDSLMAVIGPVAAAAVRAHFGQERS
ncbi:MAG: excinuclease ABC subunit UvrC [Acidobacteria bacterium]|nr:excinuclease ABC subunit UvrC [Acidobacteriota bacterium]